MKEKIEEALTQAHKEISEINATWDILWIANGIDNGYERDTLTEALKAYSVINKCSSDLLETVKSQQSRIEQLEKALQSIIEHEQDLEKNDFFAYSQLKEIARQTLKNQEAIEKRGKE